MHNKNSPAPAVYNQLVQSLVEALKGVVIPFTPKPKKYILPAL